MPEAHVELVREGAIALACAKRAIREGIALEQQQFGRAISTADDRNAMRAYLKGERYEMKGQ